MAKGKSVLLKIVIGLITVILLLVAGIYSFIKLAPQFGAPPSGDHLTEIKKSPNYQVNQFINLIETSLDYSFSNSIEVIQEYNKAANLAPESPIKTHFSMSNASIPDNNFRVTWYGHSAILLEFENKRIFLDPMLGDYAAPVSFFGQRFPNAPKLDLKSIGELDAVVFSHDHYDHLDYSTVKAIHEHVGHFYVPLGLGSHLKRWGVPENKITELDWWESAYLEEFTFTAAPARHFSGRSIRDSNKTLWASWVIRKPGTNIYFSGDGGYGPHFKEIGEKLGPFDFAMMECGQYNIRWQAIHMMPEETVQASLDLNTKAMMPIHWGAFTLSPHPWIEPAERVKVAAEKEHLKLITPEIGDAFNYPNEQPMTTWWKAVD